MQSYNASTVDGNWMWALHGQHPQLLLYVHTLDGFNFDSNFLS